MSLDEEKSRIEDLKRSLYSRTAPDVRSRRKLRYSDPSPQVESSWKPESDVPVESTLNKYYQDHSMSFLKKLLIGSAVFCLIAVGIGSYLFFNGSNLISANNIEITIDGPVSIPGGDPMEFNVGIKNDNNIDLRSVDMSVTFPAGATDPIDQTQELKKYSKYIGELATGGKTVEKVQAIIFGEENTTKEIVVSLTYSIKGSTAVFTKKKSYEVLLSSSPIALSASSFKEVTSGQEFDLKVEIKSNSEQVLKNIILNASYPSGFVYISSSIKSISTDNNMWKIGDLPAGATRTLTIHGRLQGEDSDSRSFRFFVGAQDSGGGNRIGTQYMSLQKDITIQKPFMSMNVYIDNDSELTDFIGEFNRSHRVDLYWFNNLAVPVQNAVIVAHLSGSAYNKSAVEPNGGYYRSATDDIIWNPQTTPELASIEAGGSGHVSFSIMPKDMSTDAAPVVNPKLDISVNVSGDRSQESQVPETLTAISSRTIRVSSNISLTGRVVRTVGPFTNTGPIPPRAEKKTTYTVIWSVDNTSSSVGNAKVVATLPAYTKWVGSVSPTGESVFYDQNNGTVTWDIGSLSTYTIGSSRRRELYFQVSFEPGVDLIGQIPTLVGEAELTAIDNYTGVNLSDRQDFLTTSFSTDPTYKGTDGYVGE
jgi:hypothetical protein